MGLWQFVMWVWWFASNTTIWLFNIAMENHHV
jgi:hypothetical protein